MTEKKSKYIEKFQNGSSALSDKNQVPLENVQLAWDAALKNNPTLIESPEYKQFLVDKDNWSITSKKSEFPEIKLNFDPKDSLVNTFDQTQVNVIPESAIKEADDRILNQERTNKFINESAPFSEIFDRPKNVEHQWEGDDGIGKVIPIEEKGKWDSSINIRNFYKKNRDRHRLANLGYTGQGGTEEQYLTRNIYDKLLHGNTFYTSDDKDIENLYKIAQESAKDYYAIPEEQRTKFTADNLEDLIQSKGNVYVNLDKDEMSSYKQFNNNATDRNIYNQLYTTGMDRSKMSSLDAQIKDAANWTDDEQLMAAGILADVVSFAPIPGLSLVSGVSGPIMQYMADPENSSLGMTSLDVGLSAVAGVADIVGGNAVSNLLRVKKIANIGEALAKSPKILSKVAIGLGKIAGKTLTGTAPIIMGNMLYQKIERYGFENTMKNLTIRELQSMVNASLIASRKWVPKTASEHKLLKSSDEPLAGKTFDFESSMTKELDDKLNTNIFDNTGDLIKDKKKSVISSTAAVVNPIIKTKNELNKAYNAITNVDTKINKAFTNLTGKIVAPKGHSVVDVDDGIVYVKSDKQKEILDEFTANNKKLNPSDDEVQAFLKNTDSDEFKAVKKQNEGKIESSIETKKVEKRDALIKSEVEKQLKDKKASEESKSGKWLPNIITSERKKITKKVNEENPLSSIKLSDDEVKIIEDNLLHSSAINSIRKTKSNASMNDDELVSFVNSELKIIDDKGDDLTNIEIGKKQYLNSIDPNNITDKQRQVLKDSYINRERLNSLKNPEYKTFLKSKVGKDGVKHSKLKKYGGANINRLLFFDEPGSEDFITEKKVPGPLKYEGTFSGTKSSSGLNLEGIDINSLEFLGLDDKFNVIVKDEQQFPTSINKGINKMSGLVIRNDGIIYFEYNNDIYKIGKDKKITLDSKGHQKDLKGFVESKQIGGSLNPNQFETMEEQYEYKMVDGVWKRVPKFGTDAWKDNYEKSQGINLDIDDTLFNEFDQKGLSKYDSPREIDTEWKMINGKFQKVLKEYPDNFMTAYNPPIQRSIEGEVIDPKTGIIDTGKGRDNRYLASGLIEGGVQHLLRRDNISNLKNRFASYIGGLRGIKYQPKYLDYKEEFIPAAQVNEDTYSSAKSEIDQALSSRRKPNSADIKANMLISNAIKQKGDVEKAKIDLARGKDLDAAKREEYARQERNNQRRQAVTNANLSLENAKAKEDAEALANILGVEQQGYTDLENKSLSANSNFVSSIAGLFSKQRQANSLYNTNNQEMASQYFAFKKAAEAYTEGSEEKAWYENQANILRNRLNIK